MRQVLRAGVLGRPRGMGWGVRQEGGSGWGTHINPWLIHVNVWQKPLQYCKVISLQLIIINGKKRENNDLKICSLLGEIRWSWKDSILLILVLEVKMAKRDSSYSHLYLIKYSRSFE